MPASQLLKEADPRPLTLTLSEPSGQKPGAGTAVIWSPDLGVFAVNAAGVLCAFTRVLGALPGQCLRREPAQIPSSLMLLELRGYGGSVVRLHVNAADALVIVPRDSAPDWMFGARPGRVRHLDAAPTGQDHYQPEADTCPTQGRQGAHVSNHPRVGPAGRGRSRWRRAGRGSGCAWGAGTARPSGPGRKVSLASCVVGL
jgi:hypothetical protein